jgi:FPC/CPF motif-containing protein YcgG
MSEPITTHDNPFAGRARARRLSAYHAPQGAALTRLRPFAGPAVPLLGFVHASLRALVLNPHYPCVGARSAFARGDYRIGLYPRLGGAASADGLAHDLWEFVREMPPRPDRLASYIASFEGPPLASESAFERLLWRQLQRLHDRDAAQHAWDGSVSDDGDDPRFSFSFAGRAFFVVGLHPAASRWSRRFAWPTLVFNAHAQFEMLRRSGRFERMRLRIRQRDAALQGSINPVLADFGEASEARQYSGRHTPRAWRCPFRARRQEQDR